MTDKIELKQSGLKCDNLKCDWEDMTISHLDYKQYVDAPCPKCGENILTEEDYNMAMLFHFAVDAVNNMSDEEIESLEIPDISLFSAEDNKKLKENPDQIFKVSVDLHKDIKFKIEE